MSAPTRVTVAAVLAAAGFLTAGCGGDDGKPTKDNAAVNIAKAGAPTRPDTKPKPKPLPDDAEAAQSFALPSGEKLTQKAPAPGAAKAAAKKVSDQQASEDYVSPGAPSDAEIAAELKQMQAAQQQQAKTGGTAHGITLNADGTATPAPGVPAVVARVIAGANAIAKFPYVYGGGHGTFVDTAYDCSGSLSYALAAGGLLTSTKVSGELARTGAKGPGKWITLYSNEGHTFMTVDSLRFDTSGRSGPRGTRWNAAPRSTKGFAITHPPGL